MIRNYRCRLFWVLCRPNPPENLFSDDEEEFNPSPDEIDPFSCAGWWWSTPLEPVLEEESYEWVTSSDAASVSSRLLGSDPLEGEAAGDWPEAVTQTSIMSIYLGRK
jgi:hypothetical protein